MSQAGQRELQTFFNEQISCASSNSNCLQGLTVEAILSAQDDLFWEASYLVPLAGQFEPIRPVRDGSLINTSLDSTTPFAKVSKPILISTVNKEAAPTIYGNFDFEITTDGFPSYGQVVGATFGDPRTSQIIDSQYYQVAENEDARAAIERMGTDYLWKCSGWTMARNWVKNGGTAYVGLYTLGSTYPANAGVSVCSEAGNVCHQDDIQIVVGFLFCIFHLSGTESIFCIVWNGAEPDYRSVEPDQGSPSALCCLLEYRQPQCIWLARLDQGYHRRRPRIATWWLRRGPRRRLRPCLLGIRSPIRLPVLRLEFSVTRFTLH